jgi:DNA-binding beta-propeller fold protein YncE
MQFRTLVTVALALLGLAPAADASVAVNDFLVTDYGNASGSLSRVDAITHTVSILSSGGLIVRPFGVAIGPQGQIYLSDSGSSGPGAVLRIDPATGSQSIITSGGQLVDPFGIAVGPDGTIFVTDLASGGAGVGAVFAINPSTGSQSLVSAGGFPHGIAVDLSGNLLVARFGRLDRMTSTGAVLWSSSLSQFFPQSVCVNGSGEIFAWGQDLTGTYNSQVFRYNVSTGSAVSFSGLTASVPGGMTAAPDGTLYLTNASLGFMFSIAPSGLAFPYSGPAFGFAYGLAIFGVRDGAVPDVGTSWGRVKAMFR